MPTVSVTGPPSIQGTQVINGVTYYAWVFPVVVNGEAGVYTLWVDSNNPALEPGLINIVIEDLTNSPGELEGIGANDPGTDGPGPDDGRDNADSLDGDDDGALADGSSDSGGGDSA